MVNSTAVASPATSYTASVNSHDAQHKPSVDVAGPTPALAETASAVDAAVSASEAKPNPFAGRGRAFWMVFISLLVTCMLSALDLTAVSTVIPTMAAELNSNKYAWIGTAYALTSTALVPWTAGLAAIFGRKYTLTASIILFAVGSAVTGSAQTMEAAIAGRAVQGIGGGGILIMIDIVIVDLVPLRDRGPFYGIVGCVWSLASAVGPPIGGALASSGNWRWLFYLNIPISAIAIVLVFVFLKIKSPKTTWKEKMDQMDYANFLFVAATTSAIIGLSWGGVEYSWSSPKVLVPLILGFAGIILFLWVEKRFVKHPTVPFEMLTHRNSLAAYGVVFLHGIVALAIIYYLPVYYQATKDASAIRSGIDLFSLSFTVAPMGIVFGISVTLLNHYLWQNWLAWIFTTVGMGLMILLRADSGMGLWISFPVIVGIGLGGLYAVPSFPVLAPLPPSQHPAAMGFFNFVRSLGQVFGIAIGNTVMANQLAKRLPAEFLDTFGSSAEVAVPYIKALAQPLKDQVRVAFADSLRVIWIVCTALCGLGIFFTCFMTNMPLTSETDENWGLKEDKVREKSSEKEGGKA